MPRNKNAVPLSFSLFHLDCLPVFRGRWLDLFRIREHDLFIDHIQILQQYTPFVKSLTEIFKFRKEVCKKLAKKDVFYREGDEAAGASPRPTVKRVVRCTK
jgi:hypothetical protein